MLYRIILLLVSIVASASVCLAASAGSKFGDISVKVLQKDGGQPLAGAVVMIREYGLWATSGNNGSARITKVPEGECELEISMLGFVKCTRKLSVKAAGNSTLTVELEEESLALDDVVVVAQKDNSGESTASKIGRQAIDHLQATSLSDLLQLIPGQIVNTNPSLTSPTSFTNRTLDKYDGNNAFGAGIVVDGIPLSNNADMNTRGGSYSTAGSGVDLRSIGTDDIESVTIIRGIPSAEYGDLSSGTMIVNSKIGITDLKVSGKIYPGVVQAYAGKGFKLGKAGTLNVNLDYANGKSDPRYRTDTYNRALFSLIHSINTSSGATFTTKISSANTFDWSGADPDEVIKDVYDRTNDNGITFAHGGKINTDFLLARRLSYDVSFSYRVTDSYSRNLTHGLQPLFNSRQEGTRETIMLPYEYYGCGGTIGKPVNIFAKVTDGFNLNTADGIFNNRFNIGFEFRSDGNLGSGFYNDDELKPLSSSGYRPRPFNTIPFLNQLVGYAEDNVDLKFAKDREYPRLKGQLGVRWTMIQPSRPECMQSLSPRINLNFMPVKWMSVRFGYGLTEKTPSQLMLYPDVSYLDIMNVNCAIGDKWLGVYTTKITDHSPVSLRPMQSRKMEAGLDLTFENGMSFSIVGYQDRVNNGFASANEEWEAFTFSRWTTDAVMEKDGRLVYDADHPSSTDTTMVNVTRTANREAHISQGVEFDFNLGKIKATNTAFYLSGAYTRTEYYSTNDVYNRPKGSSAAYEKVYFVYPAGCRTNLRKAFTSSLRVVQGIPQLKLVISGTLQASLFDYSMNRTDLGAPKGWIQAGDDGRTVNYTAFTESQLTSPGNLKVHGYSLADNIYQPTAYSGKAETWPSLWTVNLRMTKDITKFLGLAFYVNNMFFSQPWHNSSISQTKVERNGNYFSFGVEIYFNL